MLRLFKRQNNWLQFFNQLKHSFLLVRKKVRLWITSIEVLFWKWKRAFLNTQSCHYIFYHCKKSFPSTNLFLVFIFQSLIWLRRIAGYCPKWFPLSVPERENTESQNSVLDILTLQLLKLHILMPVVHKKVTHT